MIRVVCRVGVALGVAATCALMTTRWNMVAFAAGQITPAVKVLLTDSHETDSVAPDRAQVRRRVARLNEALVDGPFGSLTAEPVLTLNLFPEVVFVARWIRTEQTRLGRTWIGRLDGDPLSDVVLTVVRDAVAGQVTSRMGLFEIRGTIHEGVTVTEIDPLMRPDDGSAAAMPEPPREVGFETAATDDGSFVDVLVVYTPAARVAAGGSSVIAAEIELAAARANQAYQNSQIGLRLRLVGVTEIGYPGEAGNTLDDLMRLQRQNDGHLDSVHGMRRATGADLVSLITGPLAAGAFCGRAFTPYSGTPQPELGFSVVARQCLGNTFVHELGHNMGANHDWFDTDRVLGPSYSHGMVDLAGDWITIMAGGTSCFFQGGRNCTPLLYFSNPRLAWNGLRLGVPGGTNTSCRAGSRQNPPCDADNSRLLNERSVITANLEASVFTGGTVSFPPRQETLAFRAELERKYADGLGRPQDAVFADTEGAAVWTQEYLLYRLFQCNHDRALSAVRLEIQGSGLPAVCGGVPPGSLPFPPRNETLAFRTTLETIYRDELRRSPVRSAVDIEGEVVWVQEYLRYRLSRCGHAAATERVMRQIDGEGILPAC